jgi:apolipoprotein N-acyltransferase
VISRVQPFALSIFSALLLSLGYAPYDQGWVGWVGLIPLSAAFFWGAISWRKALVLGYLFGLVHFGWTLIWIQEVSVVGWIALVFILACYPAAWALLWSRIVGRLPEELTSVYNLRCSVLGASAWVVLEWLRGWLFTGFSWNYLGVSQWKSLGIIQVADLGGVLLVSWLLMLVNLVLALTVLRIYRELRQKQRARPHYDFSLTMLLLALAFGYGVRVIFEKKEPIQTLSYLAVQPNLPQNPWGEGVSPEQAVNRMATLTLTGLGGRTSAEKVLVVWPETPVGRPIIEEPLWQGFLHNLTIESGQHFLFGSNFFEGETIYNAAMLYQGGGAAPQIYRKQHLVIMGEYVPLANMLPFLRHFVPLGQDYSSGKESSLFRLEAEKLQLAPLICFEDTVVSVVRGFMLQHEVDAFINMTNDGWFNRSAQSRQHLHNALFRCVEFRRPMLRVANNGVTAVVSEKGVLEPLLQDPVTGSIFEEGVMRGRLAIPERRQTFYARAGDWVVGLSLVLLMLYGLSQIRSLRFGAKAA